MEKADYDASRLGARAGDIVNSLAALAAQCGSGPLGDHLRQAIVVASAAEATVHQSLGGFATPTRSPIVPGSPSPTGGDANAAGPQANVSDAIAAGQAAAAAAIAATNHAGNDAARTETNIGAGPSPVTPEESPTSEGLPEGWTVVWDPAAGRHYFWNSAGHAQRHRPGTEAEDAANHHVDATKQAPHPTVADKGEARNKDFKKACDVADARGSRLATVEALRTAGKQDALNARRARASEEMDHAVVVRSAAHEEAVPVESISIDSDADIDGDDLMNKAAEMVKEMDEADNQVFREGAAQPATPVSHPAATA